MFHDWVSQENQLNANSARTFFNGNDLDPVLMLGNTPIPEENFHLVAQIVKPSQSLDEGEGRKTRTREQGASYIQYRMEEGLGLLVLENESKKDETLEPEEASVM